MGQNEVSVKTHLYSSYVGTKKTVRTKCGVAKNGPLRSICSRRPKSDRLLGAALWRGNSCSQGEQLEEVELESVANTAIELLDSLMEDCAAEGVFETARAAKAAGVH